MVAAAAHCKEGSRRGVAPQRREGRARRALTLWRPILLPRTTAGQGLSFAFIAAFTKDGGRAFPVPLPAGVRNTSAVLAEIRRNQADGVFIASNNVLQGAGEGGLKGGCGWGRGQGGGGGSGPRPRLRARRGSDDRGSVRRPP